jgi:hypothetical protein
MTRLFLTFFFFLLFSHLAVHAQTENQLKLKQVSVDLETQQITLQWYLNIYALNESVKILKCTNNCLNQENYHECGQMVMKPDNLTWTDSDNCTKRNFYSIAWLESGKSAPLNNMVLKATSIPNGCLNAAMLSWNPYIFYLECEWFEQTIRGKMDTIDYYIFYRIKDNNPDFMLLDSVKGSYFPTINPRDTVRYEAKYLKSAEYEFVVQAKSRTDSVKPFSNMVSFTPGNEITTPVAVEINAISVVEDKYITVDINTAIFPKPFEKLYLLRDKPENADALSFNIIDSAEYDENNFYSFVDDQIDPKLGLYYYMALVENKCKLNDTSNILTNIYLTGKRVEKYKDSIFFYREAMPYSNTTASYELFRVVNEQELFISNAFTLINNSNCIDVENFMNDGAQITYQMKSENDCYSNTVTIEHEPRIQFPNAFYPESVHIANKTFYPIISFPSEDNYLFIIYNRWGQEIYRSTLPPVYGQYDNPQGRWDGTFQGQPCPPGIYAFKVTFGYNEGTAKYSESGSVMLVR